jgi:hypothetical protein
MALLQSVFPSLDEKIKPKDNINLERGALCTPQIFAKLADQSCWLCRQCSWNENAAAPKGQAVVV